MATQLKTAETDDIKRAVQQGGNILYSGLSQYSVALNSRNRPLLYPGGFCMGVKMVKKGAPPKCLRCWWREIMGEADVLGRMRHTAERIKSRRVVLGKYFIEYEVVDRLLRVEGDVIPGVVMDWVEGETLNQYLMNTSHTSKDIKELAENFRKMCNLLLQNGVAHGDLSGPNIMVRANSPVLVDYDTMYFREDGKRPKTIDGTPPFQHPERGAHPYMELCCDNFSHHVIYVSLLILAELPSARENVDTREKIYFDREDMLSANEFSTCPNTKRALALNNAAITEEINIIIKALRGKYLDVPPLKSSVTTPNQKPKLIKASYCTVCGRKFGTNESEFKYCTACGSRRINYQ